MRNYEYKVIPAPDRAEKIRGAKTPEDRFAQTLAQAMNELGADGWEYLRADTLPCNERAGLTRRSIVYRTVLVFRRHAEPIDQNGAPERRLEVAAPSGKAPTLRATKGEAGPSNSPSLGTPHPESAVETP